MAVLAKLKVSVVPELTWISLFSIYGLGFVHFHSSLSAIDSQNLLQIRQSKFLGLTFALLTAQIPYLVFLISPVKR